MYICYYVYYLFCELLTVTVCWNSYRFELRAAIDLCNDGELKRCGGGNRGGGVTANSRDAGQRSESHTTDKAICRVSLHRYLLLWSLPSFPWLPQVTPPFSILSIYNKKRLHTQKTENLNK